MNNEEILGKAIEKAEKNGYLLCSPYWQWEVNDYDGDLVVEISSRQRGTLAAGKTEYSLADIIFDHEFAKAFFGTDELYMTIQGDLPVNWCPAWKHHLQQIALEENRIAYLEKFI